MSKEYSSFRDPSGYICEEDGKIIRYVGSCYQEQFDTLIASKLYDKLVKKGWLVPWNEVVCELPEGMIHKFEVKRIPIISYPYEWCFSQLKDAALLTLKIHKAAMEKGMILKDASAYNIQFYQGRPILIDSLSFDLYKEGMPWMAYGQFCRHFLAPLFLMVYVDSSLNSFNKIYIDGIPLELASKLLKGKGGMAVKQHIHWHAKATNEHRMDGRESKKTKEIMISKFNHLALIDSLIRIIEKLKVKGQETEWGDYYNHTNYTDKAADQKASIIEDYLERIDFKAEDIVWDFGANDGRYSRLGLDVCANVGAFDIDCVAVEKNYNYMKDKKTNMLPLLLDLTQPSPGIGFGNKERMSITDRGNVKCLFALALIHHISISNNVPFGKVAEWLSELTENLIIEFVPKTDSQVKILLATREDIFTGYTQENFEKEFGRYFKLVEKKNIEDSERTLYLMQRS